MLNTKYWRQDMQASLVVFLVALPLCLGIALASNAPLASGLIAGMVGGLVTGLLTRSPLSVSGPAAGLTVIVINAIAGLGSFEAFTLAVFFSGLLQIVFGLLKGGVIGNYFPTSVIKGMLAAIGIILILKQLPHLVGYDADYMGDESFNQADGENTFSQISVALQKFHGGAILISLLSLATMLGWEKAAARNKFFKLVPGALVAVLGALTLNELFRVSFPSLMLRPDHLVRLPFSGLNDLVAGIRMPDFGQVTNPQVYFTALTLALVGSLESLLSVDAADKIDPDGRITNKNQELFAQGAGNALSGLLGGLPLTAVIVRTTANASAGAKTNLSAFLHGVWLFVCLISIPELLNRIPLAVLASVLLLVGYKLTRPELYRSTLRRGKSQFITFIVTIGAILFTDLLIGITIGMVVGFGFVIKSSIRKSITMVSDGNMFLIRFSKDISFLQKNSLMEKLNQIPEGAKVVIDGTHNIHVDFDIIELIEDFQRKAQTLGIKVEITKSTQALSPLFKEAA